MEEEGGNGLKLIIGIVVVIVLLVGGFFLLRGFLSKKSTPTVTNSYPSNPVATPTSFISVTPSPTPQTTKTTHGSTVYTTTNGTIIFPTYTFSQSQSQSSSNGSMSQSQSQ